MNPAVELLREDVPAPASRPAADVPHATPAALPATVIQPRPGWHPVDVGELWRYRELLLFITWRDIAVRYKQTFLGVAWAVLQPLATMVVFSLFFGRVASNPSADRPYPLFVFAGLLPWMFFANAIGSAAQSIVGSQNLVTKVYFPRLIIPSGAVGAGVVDFAIAFCMLLIMMAYYRIVPGLGLLMVPLVAAGLVVAALGVGIFLAALTVAYRDFRHVIPFMVQFWMFATPCIYLQADAAIGPRWKAVLPLNPAYGLIAAFRQAMLGGPIDRYALAVSGTVGLLLLLGGCLYFRRVERTFADII